jgi:cytochrome c551
VVLAVAYFGIAVAIIVVAVTPSFHSDSADPAAATQESEPVATDAEPPSTEAPSTEAPSEEEEAVAVLTGAELYDTNCSSCHGSSLEGGVGPRLDAGSEAAEETDGRLTALIHDGKRAMPAFGGSLTDEQIDLIVEFLRESQNG